MRLPSAPDSKKRQDARRTHLLVCPRIAHDADSFDRQQDTESLRNLVVQPRLSDLLDVDPVGFLQDGNLLAVDGSKNADCESWSGEGMPANEVGWDIEQASECSDLV